MMVNGEDWDWWVHDYAQRRINGLDGVTRVHLDDFLSRLQKMGFLGQGKEEGPPYFKKMEQGFTL